MTHHLQVHEAVPKTSESRREQQGQHHHSSVLQLFCHYKSTGRPRRSVPHPTASRAAVNHVRLSSLSASERPCRPPAPIGSSSDGVAGGGKNKLLLGYIGSI